MSRWVSNNNQVVAAHNSMAMVTLADLNFDSGTLYLSDGLGALPWNGHTYLGLGDYGQLDAIFETSDFIAHPVVLTLSGVPTNYVSSAMTEDVQGRIVALYIGLLDLNTGQWIDNPEVIWEGRMDFMAIDISDGSAQMHLTCEHRLNKEPLIARYTDQDQQLGFAGDTFFDQLWQIALASASWGTITVQHPQNVPGNPGASVVRYSGGSNQHNLFNKP